MKLIVGLGNPGPQYTRTRHNIGFQIVGQLAASWQIKFSETKFRAELATTGQADAKISLVKPQTFMNLSGETVGELARFYKVEPADIWIVYDDADVDFGSLRIRQGGGSAGHHGIESIITHIGDDFVRLRFGTRAELPGRAGDQVLENFSHNEQKQLPQLIKQAAAIIETKINLDYFVPETINLLAPDA